MAERLWAPWRLAYIEQSAVDSQSGCFLVDLPAQENDRENLILYRGQHSFVILNAFPYASGHLLIAPYLHTAELSELPDATLLEVNQLLAKTVGWLRKAYNPQGFNIGVNLGHVAGAGVPSHIHWHVVPRWSGDNNYMAVIADTRVMPQSLTDAYDRLRAAIEAAE